MPFKSEKQRKYMFAKHPKIAERWAHETENKKKKTPREKPSGSDYWGGKAHWA